MYFISCMKTVLILVFLFSTHELLSLVSSSSKHGDNSMNKPWKSREILQYLNNTRKDVECSEVLNRNSSSQCDFVKTTPDCQLSDGFIQYLYLPYCLLPHGVAFFILFLWMGFLFVVLGITADDYFCPSLVIISRTLRTSQNVAGVTFLAYGNGAPDIFSTIAAFSHSQLDNSAAELGIEALLGAGIFVTTIVMGVISLISRNFTVTRRPFIRDIIFYMGAVAWMSIALHRRELTMWQSIGLIILYVVYVIVVVVGHSIYQYWKRKSPKGKGMQNATNGDAEPIRSLFDSQSDSIQHLPESPGPDLLPDETSPLLNAGISPVVSYRVMSLRGRPLKRLVHDLLPFTMAEWQQTGLFGKAIMLIKAPAAFALNLTIPVVDYTEPDRHWNKWLYVINCVTGPVFVVMAVKVGTVLVGASFPLWALTLCIGIIIGLFVAIVTKNEQPPKCQWMFSYLAFVVSVVWIYITANEIVNLLQTFGLAFKITDAVLGLTLLAWGNSIGDLVTNSSMARQGFHNMGASACFGGPMLNLLLGIGISCTIASVKQGHSVKLPHQGHQYIISTGFLTASLVSSGVIIPLMGFRVPRLYGVYLILLYLAYLTVSIIAAVKHI